MESGSSAERGEREGLRALFAPGGPLSRLLPGYEARPQQVELAEAVWLALTRGEAGFFEAGTGTGKSLAYLIPAAMFALDQNARVVVSTYTISLQEQLLTKDIPRVQQLFPGLKSALVKGWGNYVCRLRLEARLFGEGELFEGEERPALERIAAWAEETEDGSRSDLPFEPGDALWSLVCAESDSCLRSACPYYQRCPFFRDRAAMAQAHILVVNHHLLFADVAVRRELGWETEQAVLPDYRAAILDEAHHVEDVATSYLGASLASLGVEQLFGRLYRMRQGRARGLLPTLALVLERAGDTLPGAEALREGVSEWPALVHEAEQAVQRFLGRAEAIVLEGRGRGAPFAAPERGEKFRLEVRHVQAWQGEAAPAALEAARRVETLGALLSSSLGVLGTPEEASLLGLKGQLEAARRRLAGLAHTLAEFGEPDLGAYVYWIESLGTRRGVRLVRAPVEVGEAVLEWVERQLESVVLLSATLSVGGSFEYQRRRLGLVGRSEIAAKLGVREARFDSPFDYRRQALLGLIDDIPEPTALHYLPYLAECVWRLVRASRGRALVLFTSFAALGAVRAAIAPRVEAAGLTLLAQGEQPRPHLLTQFRAGRGSVLLGTDSFWEGIDVPGEALSLVILTRLPFDVPTDPVAQARSERVRAAGGSPFGDYALPRAVLKLKQGFGRLIRTATDRGAVVICDRRVRTRAYGRLFLEALPPCRVEEGPVEQVARAVASFLGEST